MLQVRLVFHSTARGDAVRPEIFEVDAEAFEFGKFLRDAGRISDSL